MLTLWSLTILALVMQQPAAQLSAIQGTVVRTGTSDPIEGSQVMLVAGAGGAAGGEAQTLQSTVTDRSGRFVFANVPAGRYAVRVQHDGYFGPSAADSPSPAAIEPAVVTANQPTAMTIELTPGAVITGQVRDASGQPASNVNVQAYMLSYSGGVPSLRSVVSKMTDDRGAFRLFWVAPGDYYIGVTPRGPSAAAVAARIPQSMKTFYPGVTDLGATAALMVKPGEEVSGIDITLQSARPLRISGTVTSSVAPPPAPATAQGAFAVIARNQNNSAYLMLVNRDPAAPDAF